MRASSSPNTLPSTSFDRQPLLQRELAREHARGHHRRREARAFLVGPHGDFDRMLGADVEIVERAHHLQRRHHAERAVELAACRLRIEVAADHHRRQRVVRPRTGARTSSPCASTGDAAAGFAAPRREQIAALPVEVGQRQPVDAALRRGADLRHLHQARPEPLAVDAQVRLGSHACPSSHRRYRRLIGRARHDNARPVT